MESSCVIFEIYETYQKQTYRNRCEIFSEKGKHNLVIPVIKTNGNHTLTKDMVIDNSVKWQKNHWKTIESAYNNSPFFQYYKHVFHPYYHNNYKFLLDFDYQLIASILTLLKMKANIKFTENYFKIIPATHHDYRKDLTPKNKKSAFPNDIVYTQVFSYKYGFQSQLSIIDLLFNEGKNSLDYLIKLSKNRININLTLC